VSRRAAGLALVAALALLAADRLERLAPRFALDFLRAGNLPLPVASGRPSGALALAQSSTVIVEITREDDPSRAVDEATLARVIRRATQEGALVIALDIVFGPRASSPGLTELKAAIADSKRVVLASFVEEAPDVTSTRRETRPCCELASDARALGLVNVKKDLVDDRLYRIQHYYEQQGVATKFSLPLEVAAWAHGYGARAPVHVKPDAIEIESKLWPVKIPLDGDGYSLVPYLGPAGMIPHLKWQDLVDEGKPLKLSDKIVLLGSARTDVQDSYAAPFHREHSARISGTEILAQTVEVLAGQKPRRYPAVASRAHHLGFQVGSTAFGIAVAAALPLGLAMLLIAVAFVGVWGVSLAVMSSVELALSPLGASVALAVAGLGTILVRALALASEQERLERLMETYFREDLVPGTVAAGDTAQELVDGLLAAKDLLAPPGMEIVGHLGTGGMSVVLAAREKSTGREVALKLLSPALFKDEESRHRFRREAETASSLAHPNVVGVIESGHRLGYLYMPYIAYERVRGVTLRALLNQEKRLLPGRAAAAVVQVLAGLAAAHEKGIVHRDVKPENVIVTPEGTVKVLDFGIARVASADDGFRTRTGIVLGTPAYMAPEVVRGQAASPSADLYAVGTMLYELVVGSPPFGMENVSAMLVAHIEKKPVPPAERGVELPRAFETALMTLLAKDPRERPAGAAAASELFAPFVTSLVGTDVVADDAQSASTAHTRAVKGAAASGTVAVMTGREKLDSGRVTPRRAPDS
jgi:CHASE2 domain-containing sensor protein